MRSILKRTDLGFKISHLRIQLPNFFFCDFAWFAVIILWLLSENGAVFQEVF